MILITLDGGEEENQNISGLFLKAFWSERRRTWESFLFAYEHQGLMRPEKNNLKVIELWSTLAQIDDSHVVPKDKRKDLRATMRN